eukprot:TRINITY_DN10327_c0_g2_i1.p1 TRINITY_DN10327_c0_g2~~TRINITY_DN10327_c0_g2_i1.p1  ORF type:complete len:1058 (+),score=313.99 TRINITY_DN10327_c0_g2_i1:160-3333(+)
MWGRSDAVDLGPHPSARFGAAITYARDYGVLFGGTNGRQMFNETFLILPVLCPVIKKEIDAYEARLRSSLTDSSFGLDKEEGPGAIDLANETRRLQQLYNEAMTADSGSFLHWRLLDVKGDIPSGRFGASLVVVDDVVYLFGGANGKTVFGDVFRLDIGKRMWTKISNRGVAPSPRYLHACSLFGKNMLVFGGQDSHRLYNDLYVFDIGVSQWSKVTTKVSPVARCAHTSVVINRFLIVYGGSTGSSALGDIWMMNLGLPTPVWERVESNPTEFKPPSICEHGAVAVGDEMVVFGGNDGISRTNRLFSFNAVAKKWRLIAHAGPLPVERSLHNFFYIEGVHMLALFGGFDGKSPLHGLTWIREETVLYHDRHGVDLSHPKPSFETSEGNDITFIVDGRTIFASKPILCAKSEFFRNFFYEHRDSDMIEIGSTSFEVMKKILEFVYTGFTEIPKEQCVDILEVAMAFETKELADRAVEVVLEQLNPSNALQAFMVANEYTFSTLRARAKKVLLDSYETILDIPGIEMLPSPLRVELQEEKDKMGEPMLSSAMQAPITAASLSYDRPWDGGEVDFSMFGPLGKEPRTSPTAMRSPDRAVDQTPAAASSSLASSSATGPKAEPPRTPIASPVPPHHRRSEIEDEDMDPEERDEIRPRAEDLERTTPHRHTSPPGSAGKRLPVGMGSPTPTRSDHDLPPSDQKDRWSIEQIKSPEKRTSASKESSSPSKPTLAPVPPPFSLLRRREESDENTMAATSTMRVRMMEDTIRREKSDMYRKSLMEKTVFLRGLNEERRRILRENQMLRTYLSKNVKSLPPWEDDLHEIKRKAWQEREAVDQLQAEFERQREEVEKLRKKGASKMDLVIAGGMREPSEIALASPSRYDPSGTVREIFSRWTDELRGLREMWQKDTETWSRERGKLGSEFMEEKRKLEQEMTERIQSQKGQFKECEFSIKALDSERIRLDALVQKKKREALEKKLESSAYRAASEELRRRSVLYVKNPREISAIAEELRSMSTNTSSTIIKLESENMSLQSAHERERRARIELEQQLTLVRGYPAR